jgi:hypothetical protein
MPLAPDGERGIKREAEAVLVRLSPTGTDTTEENVQAHRLKHGPSVLWQPHEPHLAILGVGEALRGKEERKSFKINDMGVCKVDQDVRLGVFLDVYGDLGHGLNSGRTRWEASAPPVALVPAHDLLLVRIEGAAGTIPAQFDIASRVVPRGEFPPRLARGPVQHVAHGETLIRVED